MTAMYRATWVPALILRIGTDLSACWSRSSIHTWGKE
jgi:hypothetical protein